MVFQSDMTHASIERPELSLGAISPTFAEPLPERIPCLVRDVSDGRGRRFPEVVSGNHAMDRTAESEKTVTRTGTMRCLVTGFLFLPTDSRTVHTVLKGLHYE